MSRRHPDHRDANEPEIITAFEKLGGFVHPLQGKAGLPDLLVGISGTWILVEVKNPTGRNRIGQAQQDFMNDCVYRNLVVHVARTVEDVERICAKY